MGGTIGGAGSGVGEQKVDERDRWGCNARNSSTVGMSSSRVNEVSSCQARGSGSRARGGSSSSSSEGKKSDDNWFFEMLGGDLGCEGSRQLELFKVGMVAVRESTMP